METGKWLIMPIEPLAALLESYRDTGTSPGLAGDGGKRL